MLNRIVRWTDEGITYEGDERHGRKIIDGMGLSASQQVGTPAIREKDKTGDQEEMTAEMTTQYRALAARANFMGLDQIDLHFAAKEASKRMSSPTPQDFSKIDRRST